MIGKKRMKHTNLSDIHCHILYGVDDGAQNKEQAFHMLELAYDEGIRNIILTPHYRKTYEDGEKATIERHFQVLKAYVEQQYADMNIYLGNEIFYYEGVVEDIEAGNAYTMAGSRYVLTEFMTGAPYSYVKNAVSAMLRHDYVPIIAHIERYECFVRDFEKVWEIKERGALIQVNASGVMGKHSCKEKKFCRKLLKYGLVNFVATDAHRDDMRRPEIAACADWIVRKCGMDEATIIFKINPLKIIRNEEIVEE